MNEIKDDRLAVYEIGYLIIPSIPEEKIPAEGGKVKKIITDAGATILTDEAPAQQLLAYTMRKKNVAGSYEKYDNAYFGWLKFELSSGKIEEVKKTIEIMPSVLRMLLITTVAENTYLGKRVSAVTKTALEEKKDDTKVVSPEVAPAPATIEEMDKSIDEMVKEV